MAQKQEEPEAGIFMNWLFPVLMFLGRKIMYDKNRKIVQIWPTRLIKGPCMEQELEAMLFVTPRIPNISPKVHRTYRRPDGLFIEMDFISGQRLDKVWKDLAPHRRKEIVEVVANYVERFHMLKQPASLDLAVGSTRGGPFKDGRISTQPIAPFKIIGNFHLLLRRNVPLEKCKAVFGDDVYQCHQRTYRTLFAHADVCARNIILDHADTPVILDWEFAGWWPEYWEYTKCYFTMFEDLPEWLELIDETFRAYPLELTAEKVLWG